MPGRAADRSPWETLPLELIVTIGRKIPVADQFRLTCVNQTCRALSNAILQPEQLQGSLCAKFLLRCILAGELDAAPREWYVAGRLSDAERIRLCGLLSQDMDVWLPTKRQDTNTILALCCILAFLTVPQPLTMTKPFACCLGERLYAIGTPGGLITTVGMRQEFSDFMQCAYLDCCIAHKNYDGLRSLLCSPEGSKPPGDCVLAGGFEVAWHYKDLTAYTICVQYLRDHCVHYQDADFVWKPLAQYITDRAWNFVGALRVMSGLWNPRTLKWLASVPSWHHTLGMALPSSPSWFDELGIALSWPPVIGILVQHADATMTVCNLIATAEEVCAPSPSFGIYQVFWDILDCSLTNKESYRDTLFSETANHRVVSCVVRRAFASVHNKCSAPRILEILSALCVCNTKLRPEIDLMLERQMRGNKRKREQGIYVQTW